MAGRPTKYKSEYAEQAAKLCKIGATDVEISDFFEVDVATLNRWKLEYPEFCASIKLAKDEADNRVEMSLYHRALGYSCKEDDIRAVNGEVVITPTIKHYPPDTTACIFWLKNRQKEKWREKPEGNDGNDVTELLTRVLSRLPN